MNENMNEGISETVSNNQQEAGSVDEHKAEFEKAEHQNGEAKGHEA